MTDDKAYRFLWWCLHKWKVLDVHGESWSSPCATVTDTRPSAYVYVLQCERCGDIKRRSV